MKYISYAIFYLKTRAEGNNHIGQRYDLLFIYPVVSIRIYKPLW